MTDFQNRIIEKIKAAPNSSLDLTSIAAKAKTNRLAAYSSCEAMVKKGLLRRWRHGDDQWAVLMYGINKSFNLK